VIRIITQDEADNPIPGVTVQIKRDNEIVSATVTDEKGQAAATNLAPGKYEIAVSKEGFESRAQQDVTLTAAGAVEVKFALVPKIALSDNVNISASASAAVAIEQTASVATELQASQVRNLPSKPTTVSDALPLVPGVIRSPQGEIKISGSGENRSAFIVNSADVTDRPIRDDRAGRQRANDQRIQDALPGAIRTIHGGRGLGRNEARRR
jgi:hypothetical protein